jgi:hypothetical protein
MKILILIDGDSKSKSQSCLVSLSHFDFDFETPDCFESLLNRLPLETPKGMRRNNE